MIDDPRDHPMTYDDYLKDLAEETDRLASKGEPVAVDPEAADFMGAFEEDALSPGEALDSIEDDGEAMEHG